MDEKIIPFSKKKLVLLLLGALGFVAVGAWLTLQSVFSLGIGLLSVVFFGACAVVIVKKMFSPQPGLVLNSSGLKDYSSGVSVGFVPWSEVQDIEVRKIASQQFIVVQVAASHKYIDEQGGSLRRSLLQANSNLYGSPVTISANALAIKLPELAALITDYWHRYGTIQKG